MYWLSSFRNLFTLGISVLTVFVVSFGPFVYLNQANNVLGRLFPFRRGLCHAYWAPNFWALYNTADKALAILSKRVLGVDLPDAGLASMTGGLVQEFDHSLLPSVRPMATFVLSLLAMAPILLKIWRNGANPIRFLRAVILCNFASFMFGW